VSAGAGGRDKGGEGIPLKAAQGIRLVVLDVDGVLTDAGVYLGVLPDGNPLELKRFDIQDGLGIRLLERAGIQVAVVSGRVSSATSLRLAELGVTAVHQDPAARKLPVVERLLEERGLGWEALAMVGDDLPDIPVLQRAGLPVAVANAVPEVREVATWSTSLPGGRGAVREFARALLLVRGEWEEQVQGYLRERVGAAPAEVP